MSAENEVRAVIENWAKAISDGDRKAILAHRADKLLMFDFPNIAEGLSAYEKTWDFFDDSRRGDLIFRPFGVRVHL